MPGAMPPLRTVAIRYAPVSGPRPTARSRSVAAPRRALAAGCPMELMVRPRSVLRSLVGRAGPLRAEEAVGQRRAEALERVPGRGGQRQGETQVVAPGGGEGAQTGHRQRRL